MFLNNNIEDEQTDKLRGKFLNHLKEFYNKELSQQTYFDKKFKIDLKKTKEFIKRNPQLLITRADKGNTTVIIKKSDYLTKTENLFQDKKYYKEIKKNPLPSLERRKNDLIKLLNKSDFSGVGKKFHPVLQKCNIAKTYSLIKIHKTGFPIRPIITAIKSSVNDVSKFFTQCLSKNLKKTTSHVDNSLKLKEKIEKFQIPPDFEIISLDVVSLFTNIPEYLVYNSLEKRWTQLYNKINISCTEFLNVIKFILNNNYFQFNEKYYQQIFGSSMGNPISPILADIVMEDLEIHAIQQLNVKPLFYFRYVDDIILCIPKNTIDHAIKIINSYDENLQFTVELSQNNSISFLDVKIIVHEQQKIITDWYQKTTFSGRYLNYFSQHPQCNKIAIIYNLVDRDFKLSHDKFHKKNITFIKKLLIHNNYPPKLIELHIKKRLKKINKCIQ